MSIQTVLKDWADKIIKIILRRVGFFSTDMYDFSPVGSQAQLARSAADLPKKLLVVVGRNHYFESTRDYPVGHLSDLKKLLKIEPWRFPFDGILLRRVQRLDGQSHRVTSWVIKNEVFESSESMPLWVLPESVCVERLAVDALIEMERLSETICVSVTPSGLFSSLIREDTSQSSLHSLSAQQALSSRDVIRIEESEAAEAILLGIIQALKGSLSSFFLGFKGKNLSSYNAKRSLKFSLAIMISYLLLTSGYLWVAGSWVDYRVGTSSVEAERSLVVRKTVDDYNTLAVEVNETIGALSPSWVSWDVFLDLYDLGVSFRAVNSASGAVTYYMTAPKATDVLSWLSADSRVASADFSVPVRQRNNLEEFAIEVTFEEPKALDAEAANE